jgi:predicted kinase
MSSHHNIRLPILTIVAGRPGAGKSTLAQMIARRIHCPLISRDAIKEGMVNTMGDRGAPGGTLADDTVATFFAVISLLLERRVTLVADAFFPQELWKIHIDELRRLATVRLVFCDVDADTANLRMIQRRKEDVQWDAFHNQPVDQKTMPTTRYEPPDLGIPRLIVDCYGAYSPSIESIVQFTRG